MIINISYYLLREKVKIQKIQNYIIVKIMYIFLDFLYITYFGQTQGLPLHILYYVLVFLHTIHNSDTICCFPVHCAL
jgi:hypothetical protein